jgi:hypothetical protein
MRGSSISHFFLIFTSFFYYLSLIQGSSIKKEKEVIYITTFSLMGAPLILACLFNICFGFLFFKKVFVFFWMLLEFSISSYYF